MGVYVLQRQRQLLRLAQQPGSDMRFESLTELTSDWYWEIDAEFRFTRLEGSLAASQGLISQSEIGLVCWDIPPLRVSEAQWEAFRQTLRARAVFRGLELQRQLPSG